MIISIIGANYYQTNSEAQVILYDHLYPILTENVNVWASGYIRDNGGSVRLIVIRMMLHDNLITFYGTNIYTNTLGELSINNSYTPIHDVSLIW